MSSAMRKIKVKSPLVILHGDEMAQVSFQRVLDQFVSNRLEIQLIELDLSAENRLRTNGQIVRVLLQTTQENSGRCLPQNGSNDFVILVPRRLRSICATWLAWIQPGIRTKPQGFAGKSDFRRSL